MTQQDSARRGFMALLGELDVTPEMVKGFKENTLEMSDISRPEVRKWYEGSWKPRYFLEGVEGFEYAQSGFDATVSQFQKLLNRINPSICGSILFPTTSSIQNNEGTEYVFEKDSDALKKDLNYFIDESFF